MADVHDKATRSKNMRAIATRDTAIEKRLAGLLSAQGITFHTQDATLPGKPDFVVNDYDCVIFTHGCFWHHHHCYLFKVPATRRWRSAWKSGSAAAAPARRSTPRGFIYWRESSVLHGVTTALTGNRYLPRVTSTTANTITPSAAHSTGDNLSPPRPVPSNTATTGFT